jgi:FAD/FMN-containing dehydrogenase
MTILDEEEFVASAVVYPGSTKEVQKVVQWANKHHVPIFPISMGRNRKLSTPTPR